MSAVAAAWARKIASSWSSVKPAAAMRWSNAVRLKLPSGPWNAFLGEHLVAHHLVRHDDAGAVRGVGDHRLEHQLLQRLDGDLAPLGQRQRGRIGQALVLRGSGQATLVGALELGHADLVSADAGHDAGAAAEDAGGEVADAPGPEAQQDQHRQDAPEPGADEDAAHHGEHKGRS